MPFAVYLLGLAVFAQGTSEFMLSGLMPAIARDLGVSIPAAGLLTSAFAAGMVVGAPLLPVLGLRLSRRAALLAFLAAFLLAHVVGAATSSYGVLLATRVVAALANAGFLAVALVTAVDLAPVDAKARATSVLLGGVTVACVAGVPGGALLGEVWGWRSAFWAVAVALVPAVVAVLTSVPASAPSAAGPGLRGEVRALRRPRLLVLLLLGALVNGATFCTFTYLAPLLTGVAGLGAEWMPALLALFGLGSFAGVTVSGRFGDRRPVRLLAAGGIALVAGWAAFAATAQAPAWAVVLVFVQGALSFGVGSTLVSQVLYAATGAPTLAGGFATAALNVGATAGPWLGGLSIASFGFRSVPWVSAALVTCALAVAGTTYLITARR
ncbi:MFS transporter, DHA1 family, chloramphenicol resistance protein [Nonomuraea maritima]|uniref:MFS transporter, DHA1 family, chloramphenicol resistance protein n=1 Tax=Nonomuraea maritima TaxID=683260 RepID=A0A1G8UB12_9ACTN|nr:Cmx/CmrA family chloramphenicol efflux MFS transporter [Nonomuraea maritima]SDJ50923.1 MFS transporter, DHA1 family, chloramphenicol resistance protein [Nonomuraea maritima]